MRLLAQQTDVRSPFFVLLVLTRRANVRTETHGGHVLLLCCGGEGIGRLLPN